MSNEVQAQQLFSSIRQLIEESRQQAAVVVNATMSMLYWQIGKRINEEIKGQNRSETYGKQIVTTLWRKHSVKRILPIPRMRRILPPNQMLRE